MEKCFYRLWYQFWLANDLLVVDVFFITINWAQYMNNFELLIRHLFEHFKGVFMIFY